MFVRPEFINFDNCVITIVIQNPLKISSQQYDFIPMFLLGTLANPTSF